MPPVLAGGPEVLVPAKRPVPKPGKAEVLIRVAAAGVNRPDVLQRQGAYAPPPGTTDLPGLEVAGEIAVLPLVVGLPWVAAIFTLLNALVLFIRIRAENRALDASRAATARAAP